MAQKEIAPYGSWRSPITSDLIVSATVGLGEIVLDGEDVYWVEARPSEAGRYVIARLTPNGRAEDMTPAPFNARTTVHEYGGGAFTVNDGVIYFSNFADQQIYVQHPGSDPKALTREPGKRFADFALDKAGNRLICVREDHSTPESLPTNTLVCIDLESGENLLLRSGEDFYSSPRLSPDGKRLTWLSWNLPDMPWDGTRLWVGELTDTGSLEAVEQVGGGPSESIFQPEWSPDGTLYFISDRTGWWNLYRLGGEGYEPMAEMDAEFGRPQWVFGMSTYAFESPERIICSYTRGGDWHLAMIETETSRLVPLETRFTQISSLKATTGKVYFAGGSPTSPPSVVRLELDTRQDKILRKSSEIQIDSSYLSVPQEIEFPTSNGLTAHAFYYPPLNPDFEAPASERPPLLVISHGGPTSAATNTLSLSIQYWTSRGIGVLDVNYGGSTGFGRAYRERLNGGWGIVDVDDCINGAQFLVEQGEADPERLIIRGGSAGGYTTLAALTFRDVFKAGASYYGISDLAALEQDCHKFESQYNHSLIGPYPQAVELYRERSPIHFTERLSCPMILFQGLEDKVVPPNQAEMMFEAVRAKGLPVAYVPFEGEQHGFRRAENIKRSLDAELYFYSKVFGFDLAEEVEPVQIENL